MAYVRHVTLNSSGEPREGNSLHSLYCILLQAQSYEIRDEVETPLKSKVKIKWRYLSLAYVAGILACIDFKDHVDIFQAI